MTARILNELDFGDKGWGSPRMQLLRRYPLVTFFLLAYAITCSD